MFDSTKVLALVQGLQSSNPRLYEAIRLLALNSDEIINELFPRVDALVPPATTGEVDAPTDFTYQIRPTTLHLQWMAAENAFEYEVRLGTDWTTAAFVLRTPSLSAELLPTLSGTHHYLLRSRNSLGEYSDNIAELDVIIPNPGSVQNLRSQVIDNNVLLFWEAPSSTSFAISFYIVSRDSTVLGNVQGTFMPVFETSSGTYTYKVTPVDIAGNVGTEQGIVATVSQPPDYVLEALVVLPMNGEKVNAFLMD